ncbi:tRNA (N6-isopentenyl adenosine(37)-C2)-methylthiotransferase MiaB [Peptoniphilus obesi]|uniref:tRNA (N6-isopentenyl adenosine(37)-C2)-methylthiotransferase MiaB n=1 Tax=Peptoniphilus obesi TaxID=1472765 RepID=UPI0004B79D08|nr:tRNA (N6-isopentenyl adenosine(37)-C2)-methylthiotransferase MiaB [Peptoniphilus obesi]
MDNLNIINDYNNNIDQYISYIKQDNDKKATIITHGCQMNEHDSEKIAWLLQKMGYKIVDNIDDSDFVIVNTCSVRHSAEDKVYGQLGNLKHLKNNSNKDLKLAVCGCMMQRKESREYVVDKFDNVDIIFGTNNIWRLPELIYKNSLDNKIAIDIDENISNNDDLLGADRLYKFKSYVNIMYGCNNFCTFCIVPYTRGRENSREKEDILREIKELAANGCKEVTLLGQNVNSYGKNLSNKTSFADLLYAINDIDGIERIRFMTSHPKDISDELIYAYKDLDKLSNFLHLPVQSGSTRLLKKMNRKYSKEDYLKLIDKIKTINPDIALSTDLMIGFPGETEEDFEETLDLCKKVEYDTSFTFIYSKREGTIAARSKDQVPDKIKHERFQKLLDVLYPIQLKKNENLINTNQKVLVEGLSKTRNDILTGRTESFKTVNFKGDPKHIGEIVDVNITSANTFSLNGDLIE